jgi:RES domain-containing protein
MATFWRISNYADLRGEGGRKASSRWHTAGSRIVFLAESPAVAMLEMLVHMEFDVENLPDAFTLLRISAPDIAKIQAIDPSENPDWRSQVELTRKMGDAWLATQETALARVPSAVVPHAWNFLLNPEHPDAKLVRVETAIRERFDSRLLRFGAR